MGEHAVVFGRPALTAALGLRLEARLAHAEDPDLSAGEAAKGAAGDRHPGVALRLPRLDHRESVSWHEIFAYTADARERWRAFDREPGRAAFARLRGGDPAHLAKIALGEAAAHLGETPEGAPPLVVAVRSELPLGAGFGSSAALAATLVAAYWALRGSERPLGEVERVALEVERRQHGRPSGIDGATVVAGGLVWGERERPGSALHLSALDTATASSPVLSRLAVYDTGSPAEETGEVVAAVGERVAAEPERFEAILDSMEAATRAFADELARAPDEQRPGAVIELVRRYQAGLEELGVVPEAARELVRAVEREGGAAKISGAGALSTAPGRALPGAGSLLVLPPEPGAEEGWGFLAGLERHRAPLGAPGLRREEGTATTGGAR